MFDRFLYIVVICSVLTAFCRFGEKSESCDFFMSVESLVTTEGKICREVEALEVHKLCLRHLKT